MYAPHVTSRFRGRKNNGKIFLQRGWGGGGGLDLADPIQVPGGLGGTWAKIAQGTQQVQVHRGVPSSCLVLSSWPCRTQVCGLIKDKKNWQPVYSCFVQESDFPLKIMNFFIGFSIMLLTTKSNQHFVNEPFQTFSPILKWRRANFVWKELLFLPIKKKKREEKGKMGVLDWGRSRKIKS